MVACAWHVSLVHSNRQMEVLIAHFVLLPSIPQVLVLQTNRIVSIALCMQTRQLAAVTVATARAKLHTSPTSPMVHSSA